MKKTTTLTLSAFIFAAATLAAFGQQPLWMYQRGLGDDQAAKKNYAEAVKHYTECIKDNRNADDCYSRRGAAYLALGKTDVAQSDFQAALKINPQNKEALARFGKPQSAAPPVKTEVKTDVIKAGSGWGKITVGATQSQIETALGKPEKYYEGNLFLPDPSAHFFGKGIIIVYDGATNLVKSIDFIGDPAQLDAGSYAGTFRRTAASPDKNNDWGASVAALVKSYGAPRKRLNETRNGREFVTLIYDQIVFTFAADKLYYISVAADNTRLFAALDKTQPLIKSK